MFSTLPPGSTKVRLSATHQRTASLPWVTAPPSPGRFHVKRSATPVKNGCPLSRADRIEVPKDGFTILELLVSTAVLSMIMVLLLQSISSSSTLWTRTTGTVQAFQAARAAFESMTRNLTQATLQNYYGYADSSGNPVPLINPSFKLSSGNGLKRAQIPAKYLRASELHFVCGPADALLTQANELLPPEEAGLTRR